MNVFSRKNLEFLLLIKFLFLYQKRKTKIVIFFRFHEIFSSQKNLKKIVNSNERFFTKKS